MQGSRLAVAVLVLAFAASGTAFAGNGYRLFAGADQHPTTRAVFTASAHGFAPHKALLHLYLDRRACRSTWASEAKRVNAKTFKAGQSYFRNSHEAFVSIRETGQFYKSFTAIAGTTAEREYVCAYLNSPDSRHVYRITVDEAAASYTVG